MKPGERDSLGRIFNVKPKNCRVCGEEFQPRNGMQAYCSPVCVRESETFRGECEWCGRAFETRKQAKPTRFCGVKCSSQATAKQRASTLRHERQLAMCEQCGEPITSKRARRFCSRVCSGKAARKGRKQVWTPGHWGLLKKGEASCRNCGVRASHLHHIVPRSVSRQGREDLERNGLPLCFDCHRGWHDRRVTIYRERLRPEEVANAERIAGPVWVENNYPYEPAQAVADVGLENARMRLCPSAYKVAA